MRKAPWIPVVERIDRDRNQIMLRKAGVFNNAWLPVSDAVLNVNDPEYSVNLQLAMERAREEANIANEGRRYR
jgi:hypothetical protein